MTDQTQPTSPSVDAETLADRIDQCAAIQLVGSDGIKGYLPVGSPKIISAALRALSAPRVEPVADDFAEFPYDDERFNKGVQHVVELFAKTLGIDDWEAGDGSENYDDDLQQTFLNIMEARNIYDPETGLIGFASAAPPSQPDTGVRETENGLLSGIYPRPTAYYERVAQNLAAVWSNGNEGAKSCILAALLRAASRPDPVPEKVDLTDDDLISRCYEHGQPDTGVREALERIPAHLNFLIGRGKTRPDEPPYGVQILDGLKIVAEAEGDDLCTTIDLALAALPPDAGSREGADLVRPAE